MGDEALMVEAVAPLETHRQEDKWVMKAWRWKRTVPEGDERVTIFQQDHEKRVTIFQQDHEKRVIQPEPDRWQGQYQLPLAMYLCCRLKR